MSNRILITGGAGYVGSNLVPLLRDRGIVYDNLLYTNDYFEDVEFVRADINDCKTLEKYLKKVDTVVWLAAIVGDAACNVNPRKALDTNVEAVRFLAENFDGKIVFLSSCSAYGVSSEIATEESPLNPQSLYAETKIEGEKCLRGKNAYVLRLGTLHGPSKRMRFDLVVNVLTMHAIVNKRIEVFGGHQYRPLLSVKDISAFICRLIDEKLPTGVYNVASENLSILEVGEKVKKIIPDIEMEIIGTQFEDKRNYRVDSSRAEKILTFTPHHLVDDSISEISELIKSGRIKSTFEFKYANLASLSNSEDYKKYGK
jgi:nucleoside-diphosphate-sugar epimerase